MTESQAIHDLAELAEVSEERLSQIAKDDFGWDSEALYA